MASLKKRVRRAFKQGIQVATIAALLPLKLLHIPGGFLPEKVRMILTHWTPAMMWVFVKSFGTRAYIDQPCTFPVPSSYKPKVDDIDPKYRFSEEEIRGFYERGFIGPLTAVSEAEMREFSRQLDEELAHESKAFGRKTVRDRHLDNPLVLDLFMKPSIVDRLAQLMGPDLMLWRSQVFNQEPGAPPITWHQATTYMLEDYQRPILEPADINQLFQLTTWIAVDEAVIENGCLQFLPGTQTKVRTLKLDAKDGFYAAKFELDRPVMDDDIVSMELKPGQYVIFSERTIHGSPGNRSSRRRLGINFRTVLTSTKIYREQSEHYAAHLEETWKLDNWGVIQLRGVDRFGYNRVLKPPTREALVAAS